MNKQFQKTIKRIIDFFGALIGIVILSPLFLIVAILIKLNSKGPVFFKQERLGKNAKIFKIWKFRTMIVGSEKMSAGHWFDKNDKRITKIGRILRLVSFDEFPQLFNVLQNKISLVGPRPILPYFLKDLDQEEKKRFSVTPGITGLAQVEGRNELPWSQRVEFDLQYINRWNLWLDFKILARTILLLFNRKNVRMDQGPESGIFDLKNKNHIKKY